ncbi:hypothetical protein [Deinococcus sp. UYEF24]
MAILILVSFTSCALTQSDRATLTTDGTSVLFANPASDVAQDAVVVLYGLVTVTGAPCASFSRRWICPIGDVPGGKGYRLDYTGMLNSMNASFYRAGGGNRPIYIQVK